MRQHITVKSRDPDEPGSRLESQMLLTLLRSFRLTISCAASRDHGAESVKRSRFFVTEVAVRRRQQLLLLPTTAPHPTRGTYETCRTLSLYFHRPLVACSGSNESASDPRRLRPADAPISSSGSRTLRTRPGSASSRPTRPAIHLPTASIGSVPSGGSRSFEFIRSESSITFVVMSVMSIF
jgi:hypothetical protein